MGSKTVVEIVEDAADTLLKTWLTQHRARIRGLPDSRRAEYDKLRAKARDRAHVDTEIKSDERVDTVDAKRNRLPTAKMHILADSGGDWPVESKMVQISRECQVLAKELGLDYDGDPAKGADPNIVGWYRNPSEPTKHSLRIGYKDGDTWKSCQPDFIFVERVTTGALRPSILDPHLADALPKLLALAEYAEDYGDQFVRIDSMAAVKQPKKGQPVDLLVIDMLDEDVRAAVRAAVAKGESAKKPFENIGVQY